MKKQIFPFIFIFMASGCYVSREHKDWDNRAKQQLPDTHFYNVLKDTVKRSDILIRFNYPYVCVTINGYFHAYSFDQDQKVYSNAWIAGPPQLNKILSDQFQIGYYKFYHDTLIIEEIGSWTTFNMPAKFIHTKKVGLIYGDTIKLAKGQINFDEKTRVLLPFDKYTPFTEGSGR